MGSGLGQLSFSSRPAEAIRTSGRPLPPPENSTSAVAALAATTPPGRSVRVGSMSTQVPPRRTQCGWTYVVVTSCPSGCATVSLDSVRFCATSTGLPVRRASATARPSGPSAETAPAAVAP
ncbi:hypothetical protein ACFVVA_01630 [Kitasatospora sp. NPDC058048]|uniref:hypothetical protein n=1 Tax=Kitasatospora sp. NPDC058048 TaxID=3346313 RepID=UPI0036DB4A75